jgi:hypothetical protein
MKKKLKIEIENKLCRAIHEIAESDNWDLIRMAHFTLVRLQKQTPKFIRTVAPAMEQSEQRPAVLKKSSQRGMSYRLIDIGIRNRN